MRSFIAALIAALAWSSIAHAETFRIRPGPEADAQLVRAMAEAERGDTVRFDEGVFALSRPLAFTTDRIRIEGRGVDRTTLDFAGMRGAAPGLSVSGAEIRLEGFTVANAPADAIRLANVRGAEVREVAARWTSPADGGAFDRGRRGFSVEGGGGVLFDRAQASGARGAGIAIQGAAQAIIERTFVSRNGAGVLVLASRDVAIDRLEARGNAIGVAAVDSPGVGPTAAGGLLIRRSILDGASMAVSDADAALGVVPPGVGVAFVGFRGALVEETRFDGHPLAHVAVRAHPGPIADATFNATPGDIILRENLFGPLAGQPPGAFAALAEAGGRGDVVWDGALSYVAGGRPKIDVVRLQIVDNQAAGGAVRFVNWGLNTAATPISEAAPRTEAAPDLFDLPEPPRVRLR